MVSTQSKDSLKTNSDWQAEQPYNELASLPPSIDVETKAVLKQCIEARVKLAELKQASMLIPNDSILINLIPLLEAKDSSEIEPSRDCRRPKTLRQYPYENQTILN